MVMYADSSSFQRIFAIRGGSVQIMSQEQDSFLGICAHFLFDNAKNEPFLTVAISLSYPETTLSIQACYRLNCFNTRKKAGSKSL